MFLSFSEPLSGWHALIGRPMIGQVKVVCGERQWMAIMKITNSKRPNQVLVMEIVWPLFNFLPLLLLFVSQQNNRFDTRMSNQIGHEASQFA